MAPFASADAIGIVEAACICRCGSWLVCRFSPAVPVTDLRAPWTADASRPRWFFKTAMVTKYTASGTMMLAAAHAGAAQRCDATMTIAQNATMTAAKAANARTAALSCDLVPLCLHPMTAPPITTTAIIPIPNQDPCTRYPVRYCHWPIIGGPSIIPMVS